METEDKELSNVSDEDFANLSSSDSSDDENEEESSGDDSDTQTDPRTRKNAKSKKPAKKPKKMPKTRIIMNVSDTQYDVVKYVGKKLFKWKLSYETENFDWDIMWTDNAVQPETVAKMQTYQKINHFPGMYSLARKNHLGRNLMRMKRAFPDDYKFFPQTFLLPSEYNDFKLQFNKKKNKTFIVKPEASCQGRGIFLTRTWESVQLGEHYVAQRYLHKPFLIDGLKFDMRIYVLLAGCDPLKIYLYDDGLGRFCTEEYIAPTGENLDNICMHLTNYAINKDNPNFVFNESSTADDVGHKRSLKSIMRLLEEQGHDVKALWSEIKKIIIKTFCSVQPIIAHSYKSCHPDEPYNNMCFELLGFDIMLDHKLKPWLIEVNHTPSFTTDTPLDKSIKKSAIRDALKIMNISVENKMKAKNKKRAELQARVLTGKKIKISPEEKQAAFETAQRERSVWEAKNCGRYERIYPFDDPSQADEDYEEYMRVAHKWWEEWTGTSIKRNVKKTADPNKPPPMVFGQGNGTASRAKDIQSIYSQKLKPPTKPPSSQNNRTNPSNPVIANEQNKNGNFMKAEKVGQWDENYDVMDGEQLLDEENKDFMAHVAAITGKGGINIIAEDQEYDDHYGIANPGPKSGNLGTTTADARLESEPGQREGSRSNMPQSGVGSLADSRTSGGKSGAFRIKTLNPVRESPSKVFGADATEDQKFHFSRKFAHYINPDKPDDPNLAISQATSMKHEQETRSTREREIHSKKVPLKLSNGIVGMYGGNYEDPLFIGGSQGEQNTASLEIDKTNNKGMSNLLNRSSGREPNGKYAVKKGSLPGYPQLKNPGNYVAPKLYELNLNLGVKDEGITKPVGNSAFSVQGFGSGPKVNKNSLQQKEPTSHSSNLNYFHDSQASIQRYYNFLTHGKK